MALDATFRLDAAERSRIAPGFDIDALERLLQRLDPESRPIILDEFLLSAFRIHAPPPNQSWTMMGSTDPIIHELLAEVWQPFWNTAPEGMLTDPYPACPGQALARRRRDTANHENGTA